MTPGQVIQIDVGGKGGNGTNFFGGPAGAGGSNGGAAGGAGGIQSGGGGGGATDVRVGDCAATASCGPDASVIIAGGGGGGAIDVTGVICLVNPFGGTGGGTSGGAGRDGCSGTTLDGGSGGSGGIGGPGGTAVSPFTGHSGSNGGSFNGGVGGTGNFQAAGGGGGGGYGGGGGGAGQGLGSPSRNGEGGGGGGGLVPAGGFLANGIHAGDGYLTFLTDGTPPVVTLNFSPNGLNGWFTSSPATGFVLATETSTGGSTVTSIQCTGATVGPFFGLGTNSASANLSISSEGANSVSCTATDGVGNTGAAPGSSASTAVDLDTVAPTVSRNSSADSCDVPGNAGWCRGTQTAGFSASDATSGVASPCTGASCNFTQTSTSNGSSVSIGSGSVCDTAGNCNAGLNATGFKIDSLGPSLTFTTVTTATDGYLNGASFTTFPATVGTQPVSASGSVSDGTSSVSSVTVNGVTASGSWAASGVPLNNGANTVTATATDVAGNTSTVSHSVTLNRDLDGDGIRNNVDQSPQTPSTGFSDTLLGGTTTGTILTPLPTGATVTVADSANPSGGVDVTVTTIAAGDRVQFQLSGKSGTVKCPSGAAPAGTTVCTITDPGITVETLVGGPAEIDEIVNGQLVAITIPVDSSAEVVETTNGSGQVIDVTLENVTNNGSGTVAVNGVPVASGSTLKVGTLHATLTVKNGIFNLSGTITPSPTSNGLNPRNEQVVVKLGGYTFTIPAHSFTLQKDGSYAYAGAIGGVSLNVRLKPMSGGRWSVGAVGQRVSGLTNPVAVVVQVGDDVATASVVATLT